MKSLITQAYRMRLMTIIMSGLSFLGSFSVISAGEVVQIQEPSQSQTNGYNIAVYEKAVEIARNTPPMVKNLLAAVPWDKHTIWNKDGRMVLAVTWIPAVYVDAYRESLGKTMTTGSDYDMWVTLVPEIKNFCRNFELDLGGASCNDAKERLNQFLGLMPLSYKGNRSEYSEYFVEFWVAPEDLFRPCLNPDVTNTACNLDPDLSKYNANIMRSWDSERMFNLAHTPDWHRKWFLTHKEKEQASSSAWTRLGSTYDWSPLSKTHEGATEFIIRRGTKVIVKSISSFKDYCKCNS